VDDAARATNLCTYVRQWLELREADGFVQEQQDYRLTGQPRRVTAPRWNLLDVMLHTQSAS
jgi:hypothetical protein